MFITIQLLYFVSVLLLTSRCKSAPAQYKQADVNRHLSIQNVSIIWRLHKVFQENMQIKTKLILYKPLFIVHVRVKGFYKVIATAVQKRSTLVSKVGMAHT